MRDSGRSGWRDPDSNRGHHDFQSWSRISLTAAESLQIPMFSSYLDLDPVVAICVLSLSIWALDGASVPNQIAPSRYEPWRGRAENGTERLTGRASGRAALEPAALGASTMPQKDGLAGLWSPRSPGSNPVTPLQCHPAFNGARMNDVVRNYV